MKYYGLATDYDGTLATQGKVSEDILRELKRFKDSGRKLILVTGRELDELMEVFPHLDLFEIVVAENGALLYTPSTREEKLLGDPPLELFVYELEKRGVERISVGRVIVATWRPHELTVLEVIRDLGLEYQVIFNKEAVMILPTGINKASGLEAALKKIGLSPHNVAGIGDAENDHAFLRLCHCSFAVDNALPMLKEEADYITKGDRGRGVVEAINMIMKNDLKNLDDSLERHQIVLGHRADNGEMRVKATDESILVAGTSGSGKSTFATSLIEGLDEHKYQYCILDPEGDYESWENAIVIGNSKNAPTVDEVIKVLERPEQNCVINLVGVPFENRPSFFESVLPALVGLRAKTGRPHCIIIDETHHLIPSKWTPVHSTIPQELQGILLITIHPEHIARAVLSTVSIIIAIGDKPEKTIRKIAESQRENMPDVPEVKLDQGEAIAWKRRPSEEPFWFKIIPPKITMKRHRKKYAEGELAPERCFYFKGPENKLNLKAQNLMIFLQLSEGIDDQTWKFHLQKGDYSKWFREMIKDDLLASEAERVEKEKGISVKESKKRIREIIEEHYTGAE